MNPADDFKELSGIFDLAEIKHGVSGDENEKWLERFRTRYAGAAADYDKLGWGSAAHMLARFDAAGELIDWSRVVRWLDLGCGTGDFFERILLTRTTGVRELVGVDAMAQYLDIAAAKTARFDVKCSYHHADIVDVRLPGKFDLVTLSGILQVFEIEKLPRLMRSICALLEADGCLWIDTLNYARTGKRRGPEDLLRFKADELARLLAHYGLAPAGTWTFDTQPLRYRSATGVMVACLGKYPSAEAAS